MTPLRLRAVPADRRHRWRGARWLAAGLLALWGAVPAQACVMRVGWSEEVPWLKRGSDGRVGGIVGEMMETAFARLGCQVVWVEQPWVRTLRDLAEGRLDATGNVIRRPEREAFLWFAKPQHRTRMVMFAPTARLEALRHTVSLSQLAQAEFRLGAQIGWSYGEEFNRLAQQPAFAARLTRTGSREPLWKMMARARLDGVISDEWSGLYELARLDLLDRIGVSALVVSEDAWGTAFSKRTVAPAFVERYDRVADQMRLDGSQARITRQHQPPSLLADARR